MVHSLGKEDPVSAGRRLFGWLHSVLCESDSSVRVSAALIYVSQTARDRLVWNFPKFISHSNFPPITGRDTRCGAGGACTVPYHWLLAWRWLLGVTLKLRGTVFRTPDKCPALSLPSNHHPCFRGSAQMESKYKQQSVEQTIYILNVPNMWMNSNV